MKYFDITYEIKRAIDEAVFAEADKCMENKPYNEDAIVIYEYFIANDASEEDFGRIEGVHTAEDGYERAYEILSEWLDYKPFLREVE